MTSYYYEAVSPTGKLVTGETRQTTEQAVVSELRQQGMQPIIIKKSAKPGLSQISFRTRGLPSKDTFSFLDSLATLLESHVSLENSLRILLDNQPVRNRRRGLLEDIMVSVRSGQSLSKSMNDARLLSPQSSRTILALIEVGEESGSLGANVRRAADLLKSQMDFTNKLKSAISYPALVAVAALFTLIFMGTVIVPAFQDLFDSAQKPLPTALIFLQNFAEIAPIALLTCIAAIWLSSMTTKKGEHAPKWLERTQLKLPVIGSLIVRRDLSDFCFLLGVLLEGGVPLVAALHLASKTIKNGQIREDITIRIQRIEGGRSLSEGLSDLEYLPLLFKQLTSVGETNGALSIMLHQISKEFRNYLHNRLEKLSAAASPILIFTLGGIVAALMASVFGAILEINDLAGL